MIEKKISIIILSYNSEKYIENCINSCLNQSLLPYEIIVVDNDSKDQSKQIISKFSSIITFFLPKNKGFTGGMNYGFHQSKGDYILFLNADIILDKNYLSEIIKPFHFDPRIGTITGKFYRMNQPGKIDAVGNKLTLRLTLKNNRNYDKASYVFAANGCAPLYKRKMINDLMFNDQFYDEHFFCFLEDSDIAIRAFYQGWKTYFVPDAIGFHKRSASFKSKESFFDKPDHIQYQILINRYRLIYKNFNFIFIIIFMPFFLTNEFLIWFFLLSKNKKYRLFFKQMIKEWKNEPEYRKSWKKDLNSKRRISSFLFVINAFI